MVVRIVCKIIMELYAPIAYRRIDDRSFINEIGLWLKNAHSPAVLLVLGLGVGLETHVLCLGLGLTC